MTPRESYQTLQLLYRQTMTNNPYSQLYFQKYIYSLLQRLQMEVSM